MAIMLAAFHPAINLLGISTVAGNQSVDKTTKNALNFLYVCGLHHIDVYMGQAKPLLRPPVHCPEIHGESGLDGYDFPPLEKTHLEDKAVIAMFEKIRSNPNNVTLVPTGSLTNIALLVTLFPEVLQKIDAIVFMGGAMGIGNTGPVAEFNIQTDPEAAKIVMECGAKVVMIPLEVTHTALVTSDVLSAIEGLGTPFCVMITKLLLFFQETYARVFFLNDPPLHDPCAVAYVARPDLFQTRFLRVDVETASPLSLGQTVCDIYGQSKLPPNVHVAQRMDVTAFWELFMDALRKANNQSPLNHKN
eukprot:GILJ01005605.1.p1 GENE.GILJ01005605.1~~GILJ01005605.1.p1  ORF type:complete len:335 (-),score=45.95 GILJ01005605.1:117-1028(-)